MYTALRIPARERPGSPLLSNLYMGRKGMEESNLMFLTVVLFLNMVLSIGNLVLTILRIRRDRKNAESSD